MIFFVPIKKINKALLKNKNQDGIVYLENFNALLKLMNVPPEDKDCIADQQVQVHNEEIVSAMKNLIEKIQLSEKGKLQTQAGKKIIFQTMLELSELIKD